MARNKIAALAVALSTTFVLSDARAEIRIGIAAPLTGHYAWAGEQTRLGSIKAMEDLNVRGGVLGQTVTTVLVDDYCDPDQAIAAAHKLVAEGVPFVVGHQCSGAAIPASEVYEEAGIILISPAATNPRLTDRGLRYTFRTCGRDDLQGAMVGDRIAKGWPGADVAIVHDGQAYGQGIAEEARRRLDELGIEPALFDQVQSGQTEFFELVASFESQSIDVVFYGGYPSEAALIVRQAKARLPELAFVMSDGVASEDFWLIAGDAAEGIPMTMHMDAVRHPAATEVVAALKADGTEPLGLNFSPMRPSRSGHRRSRARAPRIRLKLPGCCAGSSSTRCSAPSDSTTRATSPASIRSPGSSGPTASTYRRAGTNSRPCRKVLDVLGRMKLNWRRS